jgi:hypothetical protein
VVGAGATLSVECKGGGRRLHEVVYTFGSEKSSMEVPGDGGGGSPSASTSGMRSAVEEVKQLPPRYPSNKRFEEIVGRARESAVGFQAAGRFQLSETTLRAIDM